MKPKHPADSPWKPSRVVKRSVTIAGRNTSVGLEDAFWVFYPVGSRRQWNQCRANDINQRYP